MFTCFQRAAVLGQRTAQHCVLQCGQLSVPLHPTRVKRGSSYQLALSPTSRRLLPRAVGPCGTLQLLTAHLCWHGGSARLCRNIWTRGQFASDIGWGQLQLGLGLRFELAIVAIGMRGQTCSVEGQGLVSHFKMPDRWAESGPTYGAHGAVQYRACLIGVQRQVCPGPAASPGSLSACGNPAVPLAAARRRSRF